jgi:hypothetical protein
MKLRHSNSSKLVVGLAVLFAVVLSMGVTEASNMGFKMNKVIFPAAGAGKGQNWVALPYKNPYVNALDLCTALGLTAGNANTKVLQVNPATGASSSSNCNVGTGFVLLPRVGVIVTNPTAAGGILVGSHQSNPPGSISLSPNVFPPPKGDNFFPVPYHTTAGFLFDLCSDLGLPTTAVVYSSDANAGTIASVGCNNNVPSALRLGEAVRIRLFQAVPSTLNVAPGHPAHF